MNNWEQIGRRGELAYNYNGESHAVRGDKGTVVARQTRVSATGEPVVRFEVHALSSQFMVNGLEPDQLDCEIASEEVGACWHSDIVENTELTLDEIKSRLLEIYADLEWDSNINRTAWEGYNMATDTREKPECEDVEELKKNIELLEKTVSELNEELSKTRSVHFKAFAVYNRQIRAALKELNSPQLGKVKRTKDQLDMLKMHREIDELIQEGLKKE